MGIGIGIADCIIIVIDSRTANTVYRLEIVKHV